MLLRDVRVEDPQRHRLLTLFPLVDPGGRSLPFRLLAEALEEGTLRIEEVSEEGSVPELLACNEGHEDVLVLDGEQLRGAKQNRMTNRSLLLPAKSKTRIPVSCMERGRWRRTRRGFRGGADHAPPGVPRRVREAEAASAPAGPEAGSDRGAGAAPRRAGARAQSAVWETIDDLSLRSGVRSDTGALDHLFDGRRDELEEGARGFPRRAGQVGLVAAVGDRVVGMDLLGAAGLHARHHHRLVRGYLFEALAEEGRKERGDGTGGERAWPGQDAALAFLVMVARARRAEADPVGRGTYRVLSGSAVGGELRHGAQPGTRKERLVHLSAFPGGEA